ncbi:hypothetical protein Cgig2_014631 [Carnegiea gigantea]|uniref:WRKY domain-containing protein n=1 Tax=Carnegiea gigantea TaxID=171969 RepID=A0A9Q1L1P0_9CARY|nr:hypothetical protein Cgig2_014631 [Carnegiea gigantea]
MDYSKSTTNWLMSSASLELELSSSNGGSTLPLFDDSPVRDKSSRKLGVQHSVSSSIELASELWLNKDEAGALVEELNRVNAENKRLTEMLTVVCENYNELKRKLTDYMSNGATSINNETWISNPTKKRRTENFSNGNNKNGDVESSSSDEENSYGKPKELETVKAKITRVAVRTEASDSSLILRDGYQWRKYGQKVTRDNPCPRAYFKCSFAPTCPVKKKVQRSLEDQSMLVATYEGEHNHPPPVQPEATPGSGVSRSVAPTLGPVPTLGSAVPTVTLDRTKPKPNNIPNDTPNPTKMLSNTSTCSQAQAQLMKFNSSEFQKFLAEQMASSLTKDPNFTAALAAAMSGRFAQRSSSD